ncbi:hypothetical protein C8J57DRAFT_1563533, partial [Mycena rebaudengoi]
PSFVGPRRVSRGSFPPPITIRPPHPTSRRAPSHLRPAALPLFTLPRTFPHPPSSSRSPRAFPCVPISPLPLGPPSMLPCPFLSSLLLSSLLVSPFLSPHPRPPNSHLPPESSSHPYFIFNYPFFHRQFFFKLSYFSSTYRALTRAAAPQIRDRRRRSEADEVPAAGIGRYGLGVPQKSKGVADRAVRVRKRNRCRRGRACGARGRAGEDCEGDDDDEEDADGEQWRECECECEREPQRDVAAQRERESDGGGRALALRRMDSFGPASSFGSASAPPPLFASGSPPSASATATPTPTPAPTRTAAQTAQTRTARVRAGIGGGGGVRGVKTQAQTLHTGAVQALYVARGADATYRRGAFGTRIPARRRRRTMSQARAAREGVWLQVRVGVGARAAGPVKPTAGIHGDGAVYGRRKFTSDFFDSSACARTHIPARAQEASGKSGVAPHVWVSSGFSRSASLVPVSL